MKIIIDLGAVIGADSGHTAFPPIFLRHTLVSFTGKTRKKKSGDAGALECTTNTKPWNGALIQPRALPPDFSHHRPFYLEIRKNNSRFRLPTNYKGSREKESYFERYKKIQHLKVAKKKKFWKSSFFIPYSFLRWVFLTFLYLKRWPYRASEW